MGENYENRKNYTIQPDNTRVSQINLEPQPIENAKITALKKTPQYQKAEPGLKAVMEQQTLNPPAQGKIYDSDKVKLAQNQVDMANNFNSAFGSNFQYKVDPYTAQGQKQSNRIFHWDPNMLLIQGFANGIVPWGQVANVVSWPARVLGNKVTPYTGKLINWAAPYTERAATWAAPYVRRAANCIGSTYNKIPPGARAWLGRAAGVTGRATGWTWNNVAHPLLEASWRPSWWTGRITKLGNALGSEGLSAFGEGASQVAKYGDMWQLGKWDYEAVKDTYNWLAGKEREKIPTWQKALNTYIALGTPGELKRFGSSIGGGMRSLENNYFRRLIDPKTYGMIGLAGVSTQAPGKAGELGLNGIDKTINFINDDPRMGWWNDPYGYDKQFGYHFGRPISKWANQFDDDLRDQALLNSIAFHDVTDAYPNIWESNDSTLAGLFRDQVGSYYHQKTHPNNTLYRMPISQFRLNREQVQQALENLRAGNVFDNKDHNFYNILSGQLPMVWPYEPEEEEPEEETTEDVLPEFLPKHVSVYHND